MQPTAEQNKRLGNAVADEAQALLAGAVAFVLLGLLALVFFGGRNVPLGGPQSIATAGGLGGAVVAVVTFIVSAARARHNRPESLLFQANRKRRIVDLTALAVAHGLVALLLWVGLFTLLQLSFVGAILYPLAAAVMIGAVGSATAYVTFLSSIRMDAYRVATLLAVFLVSGMLASMLTAGDPHWWQANLSALGKSTDASGYTFNITLVVAGALVITLASFTTRSAEAAGKPAGTSSGSFALLQGGLTILGVLLACVGLFPVDEFFALHNVVASGMVVTYAVLVIRVHRFVPGASVQFVALGYVFLIVTLVAGVLFFPVGYYNLTAVELIAGLLIFTWLIVLVRTLAAHESDESGEPVARDRTIADLRS